MAVITLDDVEPLLPALTSAQEEAIDTLITLTEGEMVLVLNRPIEITTYVEERYVVNLTEPVLYLLNTPVISVEEVKADSEVVAAAMYTFREWGLDFGGFNTLTLVDPVVWTPSNSHFTWWQTPDVALLATGDYPQSIWTVSYTAGLDGPNIPSIKSVLIRAVLRQAYQFLHGTFANSGVYSRMKVEDFEWSKDILLSSKMVGSFLDSEIKLLNNLVHKRIS